MFSEQTSFRDSLFWVGGEVEEEEAWIYCLILWTIVSVHQAQAGIAHNVDLQHLPQFQAPVKNTD